MKSSSQSTDQEKGFQKTSFPKVFEKVSTKADQDAQSKGTGIGLTVAKMLGRTHERKDLGELRARGRGEGGVYAAG